MNTKDRVQENISALADGELDNSQLEQTLAALHSADAKSDWEVYHQIGDVLRSDDMDIAMSKDFMARFSERLEAEPVIMAPAAANAAKTETHGGSQGFLRRFGLPGMAAAAVASAAVLVTTPHLLVADKGNGADASTPIIKVADTAPTSLPASASAETRVNAVASPEGVILRDPRIDEYLMAHQRFSPSVFGSAQYARSATFASEASK